MTVLAWLIAIPVAAYALLFWLCILSAAGLCILSAAGLATAAVSRRVRPRLEVRRGLRDLERDHAERGES